MPPITSLATSRALSALEVLVGAAIIIGHNVFHIVPNEVPILCALALLSMRVRSGRWAWEWLGFSRPKAWGRIFLIAFAAATCRILLGDLVIDPLTAHFWPPAVAPAGTQEISGNLRLTLLYIPLIWGFAAFGEEIAYRGYLLNRASHAVGGSTAAYWAAALLTAVLFGYGHYYKGPAGIVDSGVAGLILASAYLVAGRNLWAPILAHGFIDTFAIAMTYLGWNT